MIIFYAFILLIKLIMKWKNIYLDVHLSTHLYIFHRNTQKSNENPLSFVPRHCQPSKEYLLFVALNNLSILVREQNIPHGWSYIRSNSLNKINRNFSQRTRASLFRRNETKNKCVLCARRVGYELRWHQTDCQAHLKKMDKFSRIFEKRWWRSGGKSRLACVCRE